MTPSLRFIVAVAVLLFQSGGVLLLFGCHCPGLLEEGEPARVELLELYIVGGTYTGAELWGSGDDDALPSCDALDHLSETSPLIVPGRNEAGGESCSVGALIRVDAPIAISELLALAGATPGLAARQAYVGQVYVELDHCPGIWTFGLGPLTARHEPFLDPVPGVDPPWVVARTFTTTAPCPWLPGLERMGEQCSDVFAARLEPVPR